MSGTDYNQTPNYSLYLPIPNADNNVWGSHLNLNTSKLDTVVFGMLPLAGGTMTGPLIYTATGGTTPRAAQDRAADVANVLDFGADPTGVVDSASAINAALGTNHAVYMPKGSYLVRSALNVGSGDRLYGDGRGLTNILVDQTFNSSATGVIVLTGVEDQAPIVSDLRIFFFQPPDTVTTTTTASAATATTITVASTAGVAIGNCVADRTATAAIPTLATVISIAGNVITLSLPIVAPGVGSGDSIHFGPSRTNFKTLAAGGTSGAGGSGVMYPPAIYSNASTRYKLERLRVDACWDGIIDTTGGPGFITEIEMGAFNRGLVVGGTRDFFHISHYHFWSFGMTNGNPVTVGGVYFDGNTVALDLGSTTGVNGANLVDICLQARFNISGGVSTWIHCANLMMDGPNSLLNMTSGQWVQISNFYSTGNPPVGAASALARINVSGGTLLINNLFTSASVNPSIAVTNGVVRVCGAELLNATYNVSTVTASGAADLDLQNCVFGATGLVGRVDCSLVNFTSVGKCTFQGNTFRDSAVGNVGNGLVITNDSSYHTVSENGWKDWGWAPPGVSGQYGFNANRIAYGNVLLSALAGHAANLNITSAAGSQRNLGFQSGGLARWNILVNATAEAGSNAGSDFQLASYTDAGALLSVPLSIIRSTGHVAFNNLPLTSTYANDAAAATGGIGVGELYRNGSVVQVRVS